MSGLPLSTCEWKRTLGKSLKNVRLDASPVQFDLAAVERYRKGIWNITDFPVLHLFVTDCNVCMEVDREKGVNWVWMRFIEASRSRTSTRTRPTLRTRSMRG